MLSLRASVVIPRVFFLVIDSCCSVFAGNGITLSAASLTCPLLLRTSEKLVLRAPCAVDLNLGACEGPNPAECLAVLPLYSIFVLLCTMTMIYDVDLLVHPWPHYSHLDMCDDRGYKGPVIILSMDP
jgi:hypothetical protein